VPASRLQRVSQQASAPRHRVIAVVPAYHPDDRFHVRLSALAAQVDRVIVVDDGTGADPGGVFERVAESGVTVRRLERNSGIATALNTGVREALADGATHVVNLDQDTVLPSGYVATALDVFERANRVTNIGIVCVDAVNGSPALPTWVSPEGFGLVPEAIQTGFVISRACLETAGLFEERLVIDCVDTEYCLRVRDRGFRIAVAKGTDVRHALGRRAELRPFGIPRRHPNGEIATYQYHSPFRRYYIARNNIDLLFRNLRKRPGWVRAMIRRETPGMINSIVSGPKRMAQLLAITVGTFHGLIRRRGMIPDWLRRLVT
jgi:rhamnosyltransferase